MDTYQFNGDWHFELKLPEFSNWCSYKRLNSGRERNKLPAIREGYVPFQIAGKRDYEPDPTSAQEKVINEIINNEKEVALAIYRGFQEVINPAHVEYCGEDDWIPEMNSYRELGKLISLSYIQVLSSEKDGLAYYEICCEYKGDEEHGLIAVFHDHKVIGFSGIGDMGYECIYEDLGLDQQKEWDKLIELSKFGSEMVHEPLPKYNKFKPWQKNATEEYLRKLIRTKQGGKVIEEIETKNWDINLRFDVLHQNLVDIAIYYNNVELAEALIEKGADISKTMLYCASNLNKEAIELLLNNGASIDIHDYWFRTPLCNAVINYASYRGEQKRYEKSKDEKDKPRLEKSMEKANHFKESIKYFISVGANPYSCDKEGRNYKEILRLKWNERYLKESGLLREVENIIEPGNSMKGKWKFW